MHVETQVLALDQREFALGLDWHPLKRGQSVVRECAAAARRRKANLALVRKGWRQFALANTSAQRYMPTASRPCYSAAWVAAEALHAPTVFAAFAVEGGVYVIARVSGLFMPDGDRFFSDEDAARQFFERFTALSHWATACRVAPAAWGIPNTLELALDELLTGVPATVALRKPPVSPWLKWGGMAAAVAVIGTAATVGYQATKTTVRPKAQYEALPAELVPLRTEALGCMDAALTVRVGQRVPGWPLTKWQCSAGTLTATFLRQPHAPREWGVMQPGWTVADDLDSATMPVPVGAAGPAGATGLRLDMLHSQADAERMVRLVAGTLKGAVGVATAPPRIVGSGEAPPVPQWLRLNWTVTVAAPDGAWIEPLGRIAGTALGTITFADGKTTVAGTTYVRR